MKPGAKTEKHNGHDLRDTAGKITSPITSRRQPPHAKEDDIIQTATERRRTWHARTRRHARAQSDRPRGRTRPRTSATINTTSTGEYCKRQPTQRLVGICYCYTNKKPEGSEHGMITLYDGTHQMDNNDEMNDKTDPASM
ncbi:hypothetical protein BaRGS_00028208 [Batillaria attramentaria]|uniref:Uncharacterized protein n=1 Tax=Batillaria attramentaria TaxID=370345 RepID=A0ABD0JZM1_9CAEN